MTIEIVDIPEKAAKRPALADDVEAVHASGKAGAFTVPEDDAVKTLRHVHEAAAYLGLSARKRSTVENADGTVTIAFTVGDRVTRKRKPKTDAE